MSDSHTSKQPSLPEQQHTKYRKLNGAQGEEAKEMPSSRQSAQPPSIYRENCDLYPKALRDAINECSDGAVQIRRDPAIVEEAERCYQLNTRIQHQHAVDNPELVLSLYPAA
ncbi:hypothetical protein H4R20_006674, partial [Coemansia guatemalensis]